MPDSVLFGRVEAEFADLDRRMIRSELVEVGDRTNVDVELEDLSGTSPYSFFEIEYDWSIDSNPDKGVLVVTEEAYISRSWLAVFLFAVYALSFAYGAMWIGATNDRAGILLEMLGSGFFGLSVLGFAVAVLPISLYPGVLANTRGASEGYMKYTVFDAPFVILGLTVIVSMIADFFNRPHVYLALLLTSVSVAVVVRREPDIFTEPSERIRKQNPLFQLPAVAGEYLLISGLLTGFSTALLLISRNLTINSVANWVAAVVLVSLLAIGWWVFSQLSGEGALDAFFDVKQGKERQVGTVGRYSYLGIVVITSIINVLVLGVLVATVVGEPVYGRPLGPALPWSVRLLLLTASVMLAYFPAGLLFQTWLFLKEKAAMVQQSDEVELDLEVDSVVLELPNDRYGPASLSTGVNSYILLPKPVLKEFDNDEIRAVIAHEQKHIQNRDALIAFYAPILGLVLMTGQNVFYSLFDFREREFEADKYAVEKVGCEEPVKQALDKLDTENEGRKPVNLLERYFGLFYGAFALSKAHPTLAERKDRIDG